MYEFGMAVKDNMVNSNSSKRSRDDDNTVRQLNFKRRKFFAVRDFPPGFGSVKTNENGNVRSSVEFSAQEVENTGQQQGEMPCDDIDVGVEAKAEHMNDESAKLMIAVAENGNLPENLSDVGTVEPMNVQPVSICLPEDGNNPSVGGRSMVRMKRSHRKEVSEVRDIPPKPRGTCLNGNKVVVFMGKDWVIEKSEPAGVSSTKKPVMDMVVYAGEQNDLAMEDVQPRVVKKPNATYLKSILGAGRKKARKGIAFHLPLKLSGQKSSREYRNGSRTKKNERNSSSSERELPELEDSRTLQVGIPPSRPNGSSSSESIRFKVKEILRLFHGACRKITQTIESKPKIKGAKIVRVDFEASKILKSNGKYLDIDQIIGSVPGIEVGDEFLYRMELHLVGLHKPSQAGIDYTKDGEDIIATSIVCSGGYDDELDNSDVMTYTGQGGNVIKINKKGKEEKEPEDQQLVKGNLALVNSLDRKNPVRVIKGNKKAALETSGNASGGNYVYDGLYVVEEFWQETGSHGKLVFKFKLRRMPGQPELSWKIVKKSTKLKYREGLCKVDISEGKERLPISAVNEIDDEKPPTFTYTVKMIYPNWCNPIPPNACGCKKRCTEEGNCTCVAKNGGDIPYTQDGAVVSAKNLIYECGPLCKCPSSCYLRVTQRGIKFRLELFKTEKRGWGVRSLDSISSGSFICEYAGELLEDKEAESRTGNDEYLFDIGNKYDNSFAEEMSKLMPGTGTRPKKDEDDETSSGYTIDAARTGNIGRFINHSCSPNLYAQNVLYDHEDTRIPHVMFFAMDNIPPLQELSYHYNYVIDQVRDANGNIKKKICHCGSADCTGRLY